MHDTGAQDVQDDGGSNQANLVRHARLSHARAPRQNDRQSNGKRATANAPPSGSLTPLVRSPPSRRNTVFAEALMQMGDLIPGRDLANLVDAADTY
jgi:hypothetical protein